MCIFFSSWKSRCLWGICYGDIKIHSYEVEKHLSSPTNREHNLIITSSSEDENVQKKLKQEFDLCYAAGVGYKTLCVLDHTVDAYLLSKGSTYHWDTCAPHVILLAMGGGIIAYKSALENPKDDCTQLQVRTCLFVVVFYRVYTFIYQIVYQGYLSLHGEKGKRQNVLIK